MHTLEMTRTIKSNIAKKVIPGSHAEDIVAFVDSHETSQSNDQNVKQVKQPE